MKKGKIFIQLLIIAGLLFCIVTACDKTDDPGGDSSSAGTVKDADGNKYNTVKIGNQVWMVENLKTTKYNDGSAIPNIIDFNQWGSLTFGAYCNYDNVESNAATYGRLYNWYAVNTGKLAPTGWHVPTSEEWITLKNYVAANLGISDSVAKALASTTNWASSSKEGAIGNDLTKNNSTGFTALPGGYRRNYGHGIGKDGDIWYTGTFVNIGEVGYWWSSTEGSTDGACYRSLDYDSSVLSGWAGGKKECGYSVRLVMD
jgi:uncharacterized protein (TIGR02145 family)